MIGDSSRTRIRCCGHWSSGDRIGSRSGARTHREAASTGSQETPEALSQIPNRCCASEGPSRCDSRTSSLTGAANGCQALRVLHRRHVEHGTRRRRRSRMHEGGSGRGDHGPRRCTRVAVDTTSASPHESRLVQQLFDRMLPAAPHEPVMGAKARDGDALDAGPGEAGIEMIAPHRGNRRAEGRTQDGRPLRRHARRAAAERTIPRFQHFRRPCSRREKSTKSSRGHLHLTCSFPLLRAVLRSRLAEASAAHGSPPRTNGTGCTGDPRVPRTIVGARTPRAGRKRWIIRRSDGLGGALECQAAASGLVGARSLGPEAASQPGIPAPNRPCAATAPTARRVPRRSARGS